MWHFENVVVSPLSCSDYGDCLVGTNNCFECGKNNHQVRDCLNFRGQDKGSGQAQASGSKEAPKNNLFYVLPSRGEKEISPDVVIDIFKVFSIDVYALLDLGDTLSFVTPLVAKKFDIFPDMLYEPFMVSSSVGESVVAKRVYRNCPIMFPNRVYYVELVEIDMLDFYVIWVWVSCMLDFPLYVEQGC